MALVVFLVVTATSIKILRGKGFRSPSVYTMANLGERETSRENGPMRERKGFLPLPPFS